MSSQYYVPPTSKWPIIAVVVLGLTAVGAGSLMSYGSGLPFLLAGLVGIAFVMYGWFRDVVNESMGGLYDAQMDRSFRQGMGWFIFSEVMFFAAFLVPCFTFAYLHSHGWMGKVQKASRHYYGLTLLLVGH
ncbi:Cytochrome c oxidase subunit 3 [Nitrincola nitratireducens]|uniref:cytochrome-c oxidase n=1 Tax=Nitrincola nitratireducens TaxID=1229521 RepID=W9V4M3_9GAMM|nr:Cytochrome c oxidase subunit 3 [Nitrincola nitratireducens]